MLVIKDLPVTHPQNSEVRVYDLVPYLKRAFISVRDASRKKPVSDHGLRLRPDALALERLELRHALFERLALIGRIHPLLCKRIIADIYRSCELFPPFRETVVDVFGYRFRV